MTKKQQRLETDFAVIAAGPAGLCAAVQAAQQGLRVAVFEKMPVAGGCARLGMGLFGLESRIQKRSMVALTREQAYREYMDYVHWHVDARLVHEYFWRSGDTINWLEDLGVKFHTVKKMFPSGYDTWHVVQPDDGSVPGGGAARGMVRVLCERAGELGVQFYYNTPVKRILREEGGAVTGLIAESEDTEYEVRSGAVLIATGGFGANPEMVRELTGFTPHKDMWHREIKGIVGDGLKMAWEIGAMRGKTTMEMGGSIPTVNGISYGAYPCMNLFQQFSILAVNVNGERICDEKVFENNSLSGNVIDIQPGRIVYKLLSRNIVEHYIANGLDAPSGVYSTDPTQNVHEDMLRAQSRAPDVAFVADSIPELAGKMGLPVEALRQTVEEYNAACAEHCDELFCKDRRYLVPLRSGPFYAIRACLGAYGSLGGIKINYRTEVLDDNSRPIPGLYAAGSDTCEIYDGTYMFQFPGNTMGYAANTGRMAAESAVEYITK